MHVCFRMIWSYCMGLYLGGECSGIMLQLLIFELLMKVLWFFSMEVSCEFMIKSVWYDCVCIDEKCYRESRDTVAERLRRLTRNQLGLSRVGSSPASVGLLLLSYIFNNPIHILSRRQLECLHLFTILLTCSHLTVHIHTHPSMYTAAAYSTLILTIPTSATSFYFSKQIYN
jgi:hypothetical protein